MNHHEKFINIMIIGCLIILIPSSIMTITRSETTSVRTGWQNAWTLTSIYPNGKRISTIFPFPKVIWNGSKWTDHVFNSSDMSGGIGSVYVKFLKTHAILYDPDQREIRVEDERWMVEWYNESANEWKADTSIYNEISYQVNSSGICFIRDSILESGSILRTFYIMKNGARLKYLIELTSVSTKKYRILWKLGGINSTKVGLARATLNVTDKVVIGSNLQERRTNSWAHFLNNRDNTIVSLDWSDTFHFNQTTGEYETSFQELELSPSEDHTQVKIWFGNFTLIQGRTAFLDPKTTTFNSEPSLDGFIAKNSIGQYPPTQNSSVTTGTNLIYVGQRRLLVNDTYWYYTWRGYVSFNTNNISAMAYNISATLKLKLVYNHTILPDPDFLMKVMGGEQPIYKNASELTFDDWDAGNITVATWNTTNHPGAGAYINLTISANQINRVGNSQFRLVSDLEENDTEPTTTDEWIAFYSGDSVGDEPKLEVTYYLDSVQIEGGNTWYYRNLNNSKVVIILFGGKAYPTLVTIRHIDYLGGGPNPPEKSKDKILFIEDLITQGFGILTLNKSANYDNESYGYWIEDAAMWLLNEQGCDDVFLFGFSAGGVTVAYEVQKDNATIYSAAVVASAPINWSENPELSSDLYKSAQTANETKVCTSFIGNETDEVGSEGSTTNTYDDMRIYYDNMVVHKEWHNWTGGEDDHVPFPDSCADHANESLGEAVANWYTLHAKDIRVRLMFSNSYWSQYTNFSGQPHLTCWLNSSFEMVIKDDHSPWNETAPTYFNKTITVNCTWTKYLIEDFHFECLWPNGTLTNMNINFSYNSPNSTDMTNYYSAEFEADNKDFYNVSDTYDLYLYTNGSCPTYEGEDYDVLFEVILYPRCIDFTGPSNYEPDGKVDMRDMGKVSANFGDEKGDEDWDIYDEWAHDVVRSYKIDMRDIGLMANKFGWSCP